MGEGPATPHRPLTFLSRVLHSLRLPPRGRGRQDLQSDDGPVPLQGRCDRHHVQPLCQGLPAEPLSHRPLHKYVPPPPLGSGLWLGSGFGAGGRLSSLNPADMQLLERFSTGDAVRDSPSWELSRGSLLFSVLRKMELSTPRGKQALDLRWP